jgi:peptidylprolyl isomerase
MARATQGTNVAFHYVGKLDDGTVFDTSTDSEPLRVTVGQGEVIRGVEQALEGMAPGETKTVKLPPEEAYGPHREELIQKIERAQIPPHVDVSVGQRLQGRDPQGRTLHLTVVDASDDAVTLDANHPLAGKDLTFELKLVDVAS